MGMTPAAPGVLAARLERTVLRRPTRRRLFVVRDERTHPGLEERLRRLRRLSLAYCEAGGRQATAHRRRIRLARKEG